MVFQTEILITNLVRCRDAGRFRTATARETFDSCPIGNYKPSPAVVDQISIAQALRNASYARAVDAKDSCNMFVRDPEPFAMAPRTKRQKPAAESLFDGMKRIADDALRKLFDLGIDVIMKSYLQTGIRIHFAFEEIASDDQSGSGNADLHTVRCLARIKR
jgi:hypothetical protein